MCLAIPPNSSRSHQYSLPPYWCPYQEQEASSSAAAAAAASTSTTTATTTTNTNKYERYCPMAETPSSSSPYASPSSFGSVANPVGSGCGGGAGASSLVSNNSSSSASSSSSSLDDLLFPATPPPPLPAPSDAFEYGLGQIMMGLSPLIMQGGSNNNTTNENNSSSSLLPPNLQSLMGTNTTTNFNNWMMMGTNINIAATTTTNTTSATATTTHRRRRAPQRPGKTATQKERLFVQHNYHDLANYDCDEEAVTAYDDDSSPSEGSPEQKQQQHQPFPIKLHHLLEECEALGLSHIISWQPHGRAFKIHNPTLFATSIMSKYFPKMKKLPSLQRQFNLYGFERLTREGPDAGAYYHEAFLRYRPSLSVTNMTRRRVKGTGYKAASNPEAEPNLYSYPYMTREQQQQQRQSSTTSSRSSVSSTTTTDRSSYYSTSSEEESTYLKMNPQVVSSSLSPSLSPSSTCWYNHPSLTTTTSGGSNHHQQQHHHRNSSSSFMGYLDSLSQSNTQQLAVSSSFSFLQEDVLTSNDVDAFMAKYLNEEETMISSSSSSSSRRYQDLLVPSSSSTSTTWPASSSSTMPLLHDDRSGCISSSRNSTTDVDSFMDLYLALPRTAQDSIMDDLLCLNEGGSNSIGGSSSSTGAGGGDISFSFDSF